MLSVLKSISVSGATSAAAVLGFVLVEELVAGVGTARLVEATGDGGGFVRSDL